MNRYEHIVVGGGISGLTTALLLARLGRKVLLLERGPRVGGAMSRFRRRGVPFDVGLHFTGGIREDGQGVLSDMLEVLGVRENVRAVFLPHDVSHSMAFESLGAAYDLPSGLGRLRTRLGDQFPAERSAVGRFFDRFEHVCAQTPSMRLAGIADPPPALDEDYVSLQEVLDSLSSNPLLHALLSGYCLCYGTKPADVSFASHCRMTWGLHEATAYIEGGGDALVDAFVEAFGRFDVEVRCGVALQGCLEVKDRWVTRFGLSDGTEVAADTCVLTIHPQHILGLLPRAYLSPAFLGRVAGFEPAIGFFAAFGTLGESGDGQETPMPILSVLPDTDMNRMLEPGSGPDAPAVVLRRQERVGSRLVHTATLLEVSFPAQVEAWAETTVGQRPAAYYRYKAEQVERLRQRFARYLPEFGSSFSVLDSASLLTFRDYLHSPCGSAYGIKQKVGQYNLIGRLPLRNLLAAGQSAILPGVVGAMTSAFFVVRSLVGREALRQLLEKQTCH